MKSFTQINAAARFVRSLWTGMLLGLLYATLCTGGYQLPAAPIPETKIRKVVQHWVRHVTADSRPDAVVERMEPYVQNGETVAYVIHLVGGGYCLAGADSMLLPVYWYSPEGSFDPANPGLQLIGGQIRGRWDYLRKEMDKGGAALSAHRPALNRRAELWVELEEGRVTDNATTGGVASGISSAASRTSGEIVLSLKSQWNQSTPYNQMCLQIPAGSGNYAMVGCVATATAQVMRYWEWPMRYDWSVILDVHTSGTDAIGNMQVATLCADVGASVDMDYGLSVSGAVTANVPDAMATDYDYDADAYYSDLDADKIITDIQWMRPVLLRGRTPTNGHCWVVYGYNQLTSPWQFRMNMGWGGSSGWYSFDSVPSGLTNEMAQVTYIAPQGVVRFVGSSVLFPWDGSPGSPYLTVDSAVAMAPAGATLIFKSDSANKISGDSLVVDRCMTLKGHNIIIE